MDMCLEYKIWWNYSISKSMLQLEKLKTSYALNMKMKISLKHRINRLDY